MNKDVRSICGGVHVTKTWLPARKKLDKYIDQIYSSNKLTNNGPLVQQLTEKLESYLGVKNMLLVANGTLALQIAYHVLGISRFAVTTPFSFIATSSSLVWEKIQLQFADIDGKTFCISPDCVENEISAETKAIVPVHVFGNACDVERIADTSKRYNVPVIYDGSHAFGIKYKKKSLLSYGDASTLSFHATKLFHTIEGGAIIFKYKEHLEKAKKVINFGITGPESIQNLGINAKMNEFQAAMGLSVLDDIDEIIENRRIIWEKYQDALSSEYVLQEWCADNRNYGYFPILFKSECEVLAVQKELNNANIYPRRYFFPSLNSLNFLSKVGQKMYVSEEISSRILCLPLYPDMDEKIGDVIINAVNKKRST